MRRFLRRLFRCRHRTIMGAHRGDSRLGQKCQYRCAKCERWVNWCDLPEDYNWIPDRNRTAPLALTAMCEAVLVEQEKMK